MRRRDFLKTSIATGLATATPIAGAQAISPPTSAHRGSSSGPTGETTTRALFPPTFYRTAMVEGIPVFYREAGKPGSPVLLLLHGWPTSSRMFRNLIPLLADRYHVIAPDYPGFGQSGVPPRNEYKYSLDEAGEVVNALLDQLHIETFALYVTDIGGAIGYRVMLKRSGRMTALIAQNAPAYRAPIRFFKDLAPYWKDGSAQSRQNARIYLQPEVIKSLYLLGVKDSSRIDPDNWLVDNYLLNRPGLDEINLDILYDIRNDGPVLAAAQEYFRAHQPPTLIATGANDEVFSGEYMKKYLEFLPNAELHLLDTGHFALEDHGDEIASLMREFLPRAERAMGTRATQTK